MTMHPYHEATIAAMQTAANAFYADAVRIGNHPFIEFAGLMNEYINACRQAADSDIDFTRCNTHTGQHLPLHPIRWTTSTKSWNAFLQGALS